MAISSETEIHPERNPVLRLIRKWLPTTENYVNGRFVVRSNDSICATPLLIVLLMVETTDLIFAVDSIPAILAITTDPFIVYTSNVFAILGLRALYFALAGITAIRYIHYGLAVILVFVGVKMMISFVYHIPISWSLGFIGFVILIAALASAWADRKQTNAG
jgi:tellurite resistance protein TerC